MAGRRYNADYKYFERIILEYESGSLSRSRFNVTFQRLRSIVNSRIVDLEANGLGSDILDEIEFFNTLSNDDESILFSAFSRSDDPIAAYYKMLKFYGSAFSTKSEYRKAAEKISNDFRNAGLSDLSDNPNFIDFVVKGDFAELVGFKGNSIAAFTELEDIINSGTTIEEFKEAFRKFISRGDADDYFAMINSIRK